MTPYILAIGCFLWTVQPTTAMILTHENGINERDEGSSSQTQPPSSLEDKLLNSFDSVLEEARRNLSVLNDLDAIKSQSEKNTEFGTDETNEKSFRNWLLYSRSLLILTQVGEDGSKRKALRELEKAKNQKKQWLQDSMAYIEDSMDPKKYYEGIRSQVATFDEEERQSLITAYKNGKELEKSLEKALMWENFLFKY